MLTRNGVETKIPAPDDAVYSSVEEDDSAIAEGGFPDERFYAWHILLEAIERQTSTSGAGSRGRDRVVALIREADDGGLGKIDLLVELADMAAALAMRVHDDPFAALALVHREMLAVWRERA
jgi:hypothetical protein